MEHVEKFCSTNTHTKFKGKLSTSLIVHRDEMTIQDGKIHFIFPREKQQQLCSNWRIKRGRKGATFYRDRNHIVCGLYPGECFKKISYYEKIINNSGK